MTDGQDIKDAKVIKKLAEGDTLEATGEVLADAAGIHRVQGKCVKGGEVGWITTIGNAGTVFAAVMQKQYSVVKEQQVTRKYMPEGDVVRKAEPGEAFQVLEGPRRKKRLPSSVSRFAQEAMVPKDG